MTVSLISQFTILLSVSSLTGLSGSNSMRCPDPPMLTLSVLS